ncbi:LOW QUALITY PROTEIN: tumor necrosis factor ligand superfamily member 14-like [Archocentrus centrarchus]|uniref:LOW QUALITY PROTEIN: tumor necrosis factor ligand superfamily member 14-like n=1 Tax=Archocentrus centrarchus TaxID=63155 RepID=UPI0011EA33DF|nr:LOW QUALITY PROTEIN: tumor necrosis factor ligand superfamily member 14-like [Archocentrus centrarchus]
MSEGGVGTCPQVFVVDSQASYINMPTERKPRWTSQLQKFLLLLVGLAMLGIIVEGFLIYNLYQKTKEFPLSSPQHLYQNLSNPKAQSQVGYRGDSNEIPSVQTQTQQRAFAHLLGPSNSIGEGDVVQWVEEGDAVTQNMKYDKGRLIVEREGYYYLYSKVQMNAGEECVLIQHKVMKKTKAYDHPLELMQSKSHRCSTSRPIRLTSSEPEDLWNSYLAGIFQLHVGDEIYVTLKNIQKIRPGPSENFMGAFMVSP